MGDPSIIPAGIHDDHTHRLVVLVRELDRGLSRGDSGHSVWYLTWRDQMASAIGVHELELVGRHIDRKHDGPLRPSEPASRA